MEYCFTPKGVCSKQFHAEISDEGIIESLSVEEGCNGYGSGVSRLVRGMHIDEVIEQFDGIRCGRKKTSCPDQMAKMFAEIRDQRR